MKLPSEAVVPNLSKIPPAPFGRKGWPWECAPERNSRDVDLLVHWPKITVVTPSFNQGRFLEQTLRSVLLQQYPNLEYIVMDGGSSDNSIAIIDKYRSLLSYSQSKPDGGQAKALGLGFERATGELYGYLNSDDILFPGALRHIARTFLRFPNAGVVYGNRMVIDEAGKVTGRHIWPYLLSRYHWANGQPLAQECCYWRKEVYLKVGGIDRSKFFIMDYDLLYRMWTVSKFCKTRAYLGAIRLHGETKNARYRDVWQRELAKAKLDFGLREPGYFRIRIMNRMDRMQFLFDEMADRVCGSKLPSIE